MKIPAIVISSVVVVAALVFWMRGGAHAPPAIAAVKDQMSPEQLALGDPIENAIGMVLIPIAAGEFVMGTERGEGDQDRTASPPHPVTLSRPFYISVCEVTQGQYEQVMGASPWAGQPLVVEGENYAASYIQLGERRHLLRKPERTGGRQYRLPLRPSGSTPAGPEPIRPTASETTAKHSTTMPGTHRTPMQSESSTPISSDRNSPIPGVCMTCTATFGSGVATGSLRMETEGTY